MTTQEQQYHLKFSGEAGASVDDYLEYHRIVGDDDGGKLFSPAEYEEYKNKVAKKRLRNRIFVSWSLPDGKDCKLIGPETECMCQHRYKDHKTDFEVIPSTRPISQPCRVSGCKCKFMTYVPRQGSCPVRCRCKHETTDHKSNAPNACKRCSCQGFSSSFLCGCGVAASRHEMMTETAQEREARGLPIGKPTMYQAMGGVTGFSSLLDGHERFDPSGIGALDERDVAQPIGPSDHPFLRANLPAVVKAGEMSGGADEREISEMMAAMKKPGEDDMDFYERRYQQRLKEEKQRKRLGYRK